MFTSQNNICQDGTAQDRRKSSRLAINRNRKVMLIATTPDEQQINIQVDNYSPKGFGGFCSISNQLKSLLKYYVNSGFIFPEAKISYDGKTIPVGRLILRTSFNRSVD